MAKIELTKEQRMYGNATLALLWYDNNALSDLGEFVYNLTGDIDQEVLSEIEEALSQKVDEVVASIVMSDEQIDSEMEETRDLFYPNED